METDGVVPDIIPKVPKNKVQVKFPNGKTVDFGTELTPAETKEEPEVTWEADPEKFYTLSLFDPDAPSRSWAFLSDANHWLIGNIPGNNVKAGQVLVEYGGAGPPRFTGFHRYIFLVYEQSDKIHFEEAYVSKTSLRPRIRWSAKKFAKKYKLEEVHAANYFKAKWTPAATRPGNEKESP